MRKKYKYLFGPVPSRRLGLSLGIDVVPFKVCSLDCVYCQLGRTTEKTLDRGDYVDLDAVIEELREKVAEGLVADFITISGSGEPTLNKSFGTLIKMVKEVTGIPVAVLTNSTLFDLPQVRKACCNADVVVPSLDAAEQEAFERINRPVKDILVENIIDGLVTFRSEFEGEIWLEIFFVEGVNTDKKQIELLKKAISRIRPDKVHVNTAVRPTADADVKKIEEAKLQRIAEELGGRAEVIANFRKENKDSCVEIKAEDVLAMLKRRPCSLEDICSGLGLHRNEALKYVTHLLHSGQIIADERSESTYYKATS